MKKFMIIAVALCVGFMLAVPAMALEIENDGLLRVRGYNAVGYTFNETAQSSDSYYDMRFRLNTKFVVSDGLYAQTRFRALNGTVFGPGPVDEANIQWERAWLGAKTPFGLFRAGRMIAGAWGTSFIDNEGDAFRVRFDSAAGPVKFGVILQKGFEGDIGATDSSRDFNIYYAYGLYPSEAITVGLLGAYADDKRSSDIGAGAWKAVTMSLLPFFKAKIGDAVKLQGEAKFSFGDFRNYYDNTPDTDTDSLSFNLEAGFNFGAGSAQLGYAFASGQDDSTDATSQNFGDDWEKLWILTGSTGPAVGALGTQGNFSNAGNDDGIALIYGGASFNLTEAVSLGFVAGIGTADEVATGQDDDLGVEVDLQFGWKFYDGALAYSAVAAYLSAGDYWEAGIAPADYDDSCYVLYHKIQINF
jgi:hypothetical protein